MQELTLDCIFSINAKAANLHVLRANHQKIMTVSE
jgi:hypothetical protein